MLNKNPYTLCLFLGHSQALYSVAKRPWSYITCVWYICYCNLHFFMDSPSSGQWIHLNFIHRKQKCKESALFKCSYQLFTKITQQQSKSDISILLILSRISSVTSHKYIESIMMPSAFYIFLIYFLVISHGELVSSVFSQHYFSKKTQNKHTLRKFFKSGFPSRRADWDEARTPQTDLI